MPIFVLRRRPDAFTVPEAITRLRPLLRRLLRVSRRADLRQFRRSRPLLADPNFHERNGEISPDGRWIAYESDESGRFEVYVRPFPTVDAGKWQVSSAGAQYPAWSTFLDCLTARSSMSESISALSWTPT